MVNKAYIIGNIGSDIQHRDVSNGSMASFSVATSETWKDNNGEKKETTEWHKIVVFGKLADVVGQYYKKGNKVYVEGKLQTRSWEGDDGQKRYTTEIVVNGFSGVIKNLTPRDATELHRNQTENPRYAPESMPEVKVAENTGFADDIPF